eukprot:CAMPEP_0181401840 /NCGR_PEP_ID=MMETSP1110-20121109/2861_1 /TAXON_ID=174948 /ORGANISM="Symbiodinium sp., Strain CCMP421" /LENGTH=233 /DNA_ID=CAMNT_0023524029 /DNA_START=34 /DNA_END=734 /DNA_ORIENTATION=-
MAAKPSSVFEEQFGCKRSVMLAPPPSSKGWEASKESARGLQRLQKVGYVPFVPLCDPKRFELHVSQQELAKHLRHRPGRKGPRAASERHPPQTTIAETPFEKLCVRRRGAGVEGNLDCNYVSLVPVVSNSQEESFFWQAQKCSSKVVRSDMKLSSSQAPSKPHFLHGQGDDIANSGVEWMQKAGVEQNLKRLGQGESCCDLLRESMDHCRSSFHPSAPAGPSSASPSVLAAMH